ncbi:MAG: hypothetical protein ABIP94_22370 [Planctomycetota bacterium]
MLVDLLCEGPDAQTTKDDWAFGLKRRDDALCWDALSQLWRVDPVALGFGKPSPRGADGAEREPAAVALAAKVVQHYGGRALANLQNFSCWLGQQHYL